MKKLLVSVVAIMFSFAVFGQSDGPTSIAETINIMPKMGHSTDLEEAIAKHNAKYHPEGDNAAGLRYIDYGNNAGWYVWVMKGTYASMDARPTDKDHVKDWAETVEIHIEEYGPTQLWEYNPSLSTGADIMDASKRYRSWFVDLKPGEYYRFRAIMEKIIKTYESMGKAMVIYDNAISTKGGPNVGLIWPFNNFAEWEEDLNTVEAFEELHGDGSWMRFLDEWDDIVESIDEEVRTKI